MRTTTKQVIGLLSLGVLGTSWALGQAAETGLAISNSAATASPTPTATPTAETPTPTPTASADAGSTSSSSSKATATQTPTPTPTPTATKSTTSSASVTKKSDAVSYVAHRASGTMQLSVTKSGGKITAIDVISGGTEGAQWAQVPGILVDAALQAQSANFGNVGGATHTTDAFKQALESALAKF